MKHPKISNQATSITDTHLALFEDDAVSNFLPLTWTRPVWALRCGIWTLRKAIEEAYGRPTQALFVRDFLADVVKERTKLAVNQWNRADKAEIDPTSRYLLLNGRLLATSHLPNQMPLEGDACRFVSSDGVLLGARVPAHLFAQGWDAIHALPAQKMDWPLLQWPWELLQNNSRRLAEQASQAWNLGNTSERALTGVHLLHPEHIFIDPSARIMPGVVLDATDGPIVIDQQAQVMSNAVIQGPTYVGYKSRVKIGAKIYHGTTIGPVCKVGGEIEETILQGYSNKQHDGFLGHAYVGQWCNFGADTNNSDLKNNYSTVSMWVNGSYRDSGSMFVGLFMGDHSKTGINSTLNTGTVVGVSCNIFGGGLPPRYVPSFSWGSGTTWQTYRADKALETAQRVMARRNVPLSQAERELLMYIFRETEGVRERINKQK